jgi:integrase
MTRFSEHLEWFLEHAVNRKRNPVKPSTILSWKMCAAKWLVPSLGQLACDEVNNKTVKGLVLQMSQAGLHPQTITNYIMVVKLALSAATDENGEQIYPRKWNHAFLDMPLIQEHKQPFLTSEMVSSIVSESKGQTQMLLILLAATGLRIGEAIALEVKHVSPDARTLSVEQSCFMGNIQAPKTRNAYRKVDLCTPVAVLLGQYLGDRTEGFVFPSRTNSPLSQPNLIRREFHPIQTKLGYEKCGFHAFRRFRATHLRKQRTPGSLETFWLGHSKQSVTDMYDKSAMDDAYRQAEAERIGIGFSTT